MIDGVEIISLKQIVDERGKVMHMLKSTDPHFGKFGEIYFSCSWPGSIKLKYTHKTMTLNNAVISGRAKLVLYDSRLIHPQKEWFKRYFGEDNYCLVKIPPKIINGYKSYGDKLVILANCATEPHDKNEIEYIDPFENDIPYEWNLKHG